MYRFPTELDLSDVVGQCTTQLRVGEFDLQFTIGPVHFAVQSPVELFSDGSLIGRWTEGHWPSESFLEILNEAVTEYAVPNDRLLVVKFRNGIEMHLVDDSDQYECMNIMVEGKPGHWFI